MARTEAERKALFEKKKAEVLAKMAAEKEAAEPEKPDSTIQSLSSVTADNKFDEAVPEVDDGPRSRKERFNEEDDAMARLSILEVYLGVGGTKPKHSGGTKELLVYCPAADHNNTDTEAACLNIEKNTWVCYGQCDDGGGIVDLVAASMGLPFGKNLKNADFAKAKEELLVQFAGWQRVNEGRFSVAKSPRQLEQEEKEFEERHSTPVQLEVVKPLKPTGEDSESISTEEEEKEEKLPEISDIWSHLPKGTPLYEYMKAAESTTSPKEFSLFNAFGLLGLCVGPYVRGMGRGLFKPSLSVLRVGWSGAGKSRSEFPLQEALDMPPFMRIVNAPVMAGTVAEVWTEGVKKITSPGSGEYLLDQLSSDVVGGVPVKVRDTAAWLKVDEFTAFMSKSSIKGSSLKTVYLELDNSAGVNSEVSVGSMGGGTLSAKNPLLFFTTSITPNTFRDIVGSQNADNGLLARFDAVTANRVKGVPMKQDKYKDLAATFEAYTDVFAFYNKLRDPTGQMQTRELLVIEFDDDSLELFDRYEEKMMALKDGAHANPVQSRFDLKLAKYSLLFALNSKHEKIMREDVANATWVMEYLLRTTAMVGEKLSETTETVLDEAVLGAVRYHYARESGFATQGRVASFIRAKSKGYSTAQIVKSLEILEKGGLIESRQSTAARGPKTPRYYPNVTDDWNEPQSPKAIKETKK